MRQVLTGLTALVMACSANEATGPVAPVPTGPVAPVAPVPVASVTIVSAPELMHVGNTHQLRVILRSAGGAVLTQRTVVFTSSDTSILWVDGDGMVQALAIGTAAITATSEGKSDSVTILVTEADICLGSPNCWDY